MVEYSTHSFPPHVKVYWRTGLRCLSRLATSWSFLWECWFLFGMIAVIALLPVSVLFLTALLFRTFLWTNSHQYGGVDLQPAVPGVTIPWFDLFYLVFSLIVASVFHEAGHALAAFREGLSVNRFGFLFVLCFPAAFVDLDGKELQSLPPSRQLRVSCAGVWHNISSLGVALALLFLLPFLLSPFYVHNTGVSVISVDKRSGLGGDTGLKEGAILAGIDDCVIKNADDWNACIMKAISRKSNGFCFPLSAIHILDETLYPNKFMKDDTINCCPTDSARHICFHATAPNDQILHSHFCLPVRPLLAEKNGRCASQDECSPGFICSQPPYSNHTSLIEISQKESQSVLFLGPPHELYTGAKVSSYISTYWNLSVSLPERLEKLLKYFIALSGGLALFNIVPCVALDGHWIAQGLMLWIFPHRDKDRLTLTVILCLGTLLIGLNIIVAVGKLFF